MWRIAPQEGLPKKDPNCNLLHMRPTGTMPETTLESRRRRMVMVGTTILETVATITTTTKTTMVEELVTPKQQERCSP